MPRSWVYIMASHRNGTLYTGVTTDLPGRVYQHKDGTLAGFTAEFHCHLLVYYEGFDDIRLAIQREKILKKWHRSWKIRLIEKVNPEWRDLSSEI